MQDAARRNLRLARPSISSWFPACTENPSPPSCGTPEDLRRQVPSVCSHRSKVFFRPITGLYEVTSVPVQEAGTQVATLTVGALFDISRFGVPAVLLHNGSVIATEMRDLAPAQIEKALAACASRPRVRTSHSESDLPFAASRIDGSRREKTIMFCAACKTWTRPARRCKLSCENCFWWPGWRRWPRCSASARFLRGRSRGRWRMSRLTCAAAR